MNCLAFECIRCLTALAARTGLIVKVATLLLLVCASVFPALAESSNPAEELNNARRIFVPVEELDVVMERDHRGVLLTKNKFQEILNLALANAPKGQTPQIPVVLTNSEYRVRVAGDQLLISVTAELTQFVDDWQSILFPMQRLAIENGLIDDQPAMMGRNNEGALLLFSEKKGKHVLKLEMSTELNSLGSDQVAAFSLLRAPTGTLSITLPPGKRLLIGALQLERPTPLDQPADYQVAIGGAPGVQLRITDRAAENSADALTMATTGYGLHVAPGEVTWHALTSLQVFGKPIDRLTFSIPNSLEIADIEANGLEAWTLADDPNDKKRTTISVTFGQAFDGQRKISFKGVMAVEADKPWAVPPLTIDKITSHIGQVLVQHPAGVRLRIEESQGVRRATHGQKPTADMPDEMAKMNATEFLRFDVWQPDFLLLLTTQPKQREVQTAVAAVLDVNATGVELQALLTVESHFAPLFELDVRMSADWTLISAQRDGQPLKWQVLPQDPGINQLRILLSPPLAAEASGTVRLSLRREVEGWPVEAAPVGFALPELFLPQSSLSEVAFVVRGDDDLDLAAEDLSGLDTVPLKADFERLRFQSQDTRYSGKLKVTRKPSRVAAQTITFGRLDPQTMHVFLQAIVDVQGGGVRTLKLALPESTGTAIRFQSPVRPIVEQKPGTIQNGERIWTLQFDQRVRGVLPLFCDLELPRGEAKEFKVPTARFVDAERQNGYLAVEAGGEQRLTIEAKAADGTPLADVDPLDLPEVYYAPKERVVAVYRTVTTGTTLSLSEERFDKVAVPTAVCPMLDVTSVLGRTGELQHRATFVLTVVGVQGLRVILPKETSLWATLVDSQPVEVRRHGDIYLIPLPVRNDGSSRLLQLFYQSKVDALTQFGTLEQPPPELSVQVGQGTSQPVEILDQRWRLHYPSSTLLVRSTGPLEPEQKLDETSLLSRISIGARVPTLEQLGWQIFAVIVTLGVVALLMMAYRKGIIVALPVFAILAIAGVLFFAYTATERSGSHYYATSKSAAPEATQRLQGINSDIVFEGRSYDDESTPSSGLRSKDSPNVDNSGLPLQSLGAINQPLTDAVPPQRPISAASKPPKPGAKFLESRDSTKAKKRLAVPTAIPPSAPSPEAKPESKDEEMGRTHFIESEVEHDMNRFGDLGIKQELAQEQERHEEFFAKQGAERPRGEMLGEVRKDKIALLSLAIDLAPPDGSLMKTFRYAGADSARSGISLQLGYVDEQSGTLLRVFLVALIALVGWFLRRTGCVTKAILAVLGLTIPLALLPLAPQDLQVIVDGLFFGVCAACALWLLVGIAKSLETCCVNCCGWTKGTNGPAVAKIGLLAAIMLTGNVAFAQQQNAQPGAAKPMPPVPAETSIIVPFDAGSDPRASDKILLPFDKFTELYRQAYPDKPTNGTAPQAGGVVDALYAAKIVPNEKTPEESTVEVTARFAIRSYVDGQLQVELPVGAVAVREAKLDGKNAPLIVNGVCSKVAIATPGLHVVDFVFSVPARLSGSTGTFTLPLTPVPSGKLSLELPAKDLSIRINGSSTIFRRVTTADVQSIDVAVDKGGDLTISWQPEQARGAAAAVVHVDSVQAITLIDAGTRVSTGFVYRIRQGTVADVTFSLPATYRLQSVNGPDVGGWELQGDGDARKLRVIFRRNVADTTQLTIETFLENKVGTQSTVLDIPQLAPLEVTNEIGQIAVFAGDQFSLRAEKVESLTQVDAGKFTTTIAVSKPTVAPQLAYRFSKRPFILSLRTTRQESQANVAAQQAAFVTRRKQQLTTRLVYNLTGSPRSSFNIALPDGYVVLDVKATGLNDWSLGTMNGKNALTIDLNAPRLGVAEVVLSGTIPRDSDATATLEFPTPLDATKLSSIAAIWLDDGFAATVDSFESWRSVDTANVNGELKGIRPNQPVQFAFQSQVTGPTGITLALHQATPKLSANGLTMITVSDVSIVYTLALQWQIDVASTDSLVFTTPSFLAGKLEFTGDGIRETIHVDAGNGRTRWTIWFRTPIRGKYFAAAIATLPPATTEVTAPSVVFERNTAAPTAPNASMSPIDGQRQYALLINSSQSQLTSATPELTESVQREDVPLVVDQSLVDQATELVRIKQLITSPRWTLQKFVQTAGAPASVNVADLATIVSRDGTYRGQANYVIKNRSRQFMAIKLPPNSELLSVFVGEQPSRAVTTKRNNQTVQLIALPKTSVASLSFPVRVIWRGKLAEALPKSMTMMRQSVDFPAPVVVGQQDVDFGADFGIPVARTRWSVWLPEDLDVQPLKDSTRYNLTLQQSAQNDLLYEKAAVQELSELLGFVEQNYTFGSNRAQARNNMKQLGLALFNCEQLEQVVKGVPDGSDAEFVRQKGQTLQRLSVLQKNIRDEQARLNPPATPAPGIPAAGPSNPGAGIDIQGNGLNGIDLDQAGIVNNTILNNSTLVRSNTGNGIQVQMDADENSNFNFDLKTKEPEDKKEASGKSQSGKGNSKGANLETRQQLRSDNATKVDALNEAISQNKGSGQQGMQQGVQAGNRNNLRRNVTPTTQGGGQQGQFGQQDQLGNLGQGLWAGGGSGQGGQGGFGGGQFGMGGGGGGQFGGATINNNGSNGVFLNAGPNGSPTNLQNNDSNGGSFAAGFATIGRVANDDFARLGTQFQSPSNNAYGLNVNGNGVGFQNPTQWNRPASDPFVPVVGNSAVFGGPNFPSLTQISPTATQGNPYNREVAVGGGDVDLNIPGQPPGTSRVFDIRSNGYFNGMGEYHAPPASMMQRPGPMVDGPGPGVFAPMPNGPVLAGEPGNNQGAQVPQGMAPAGGLGLARPAGGPPAWTQAGGLSLPFALPTTGKKLVFSKTGGDPKLALAVRPQETIRGGLNLAWSIVWLAIGIGIVFAIRRASAAPRLRHGLLLAVAAISVLGFFVLPGPLSTCSFVTFVVMALIVAWINRTAPQAAVAR